MAVKKTKPSKLEDKSAFSSEQVPERENEPPRLITEVVDEENNQDASVPDIDQNKKEELSQESHIDDTTGESPLNPQTHQENEEMEKEVITELFTKNEIGYPHISSHTRSSFRPLLLWAIVVIATSVVTGVGLLVGRGALHVPAFFSTPTPTLTPTLAPTATPAVNIKREDITVEVLNGSGVPGAAGKMKTFLEGKGYTVSKTGNTDEYTYAQTEIMVKVQKESYVSLLKDDLKTDYVVGSVSANLAEDAPADVRIIVGKE